MSRNLLLAVALSASILFAACDDDDDDNGNAPDPVPTEPDSVGGDSVPLGDPATRLLNLVPKNNGVGIGTGSSITFTFDGAMDTTAGLFVDLHRADSTGATSVTTRQSNMRCLFAPGNTSMRCSPILSMSQNQKYLLHIGGGMLNSAGDPITIPVGDSLGLAVVALPDSVHGTQTLENVAEGWFSPDSTSLGYGLTFTTGTGVETDTTAGGVRATP
jgi:hypothetical protein